jgi:hypothetical protein
MPSLPNAIPEKVSEKVRPLYEKYLRGSDSKCTYSINDSGYEKYE